MLKRSKIIIKEEQEEQEEEQEEEEQEEPEEQEQVNKFLYILDHTFVKKYCVSSSRIYKIKKYNYLPLVSIGKVAIDRLANSKFLIYLKCVKATKSTVSGYFGYFVGGKLLINNKQSKDVKDKNNVEVDEDEYRRMVKNYCLCVMDNLVFIKYEEITQFDSIVSPTKYKAICRENNIECYKMSSNLKCLNIIENEIDETIEYIELELEKEAEKIENEESDENEGNDGNDGDGGDEDNTKEDLVDMVNMNIPIVWNPCNTIIEKMDNMNIKKADIILHYKKCDICDITDNNRKKLDFADSKINLQVKDGEENKEKMDNIINFYQFDKKYIEKKPIFDEMYLFEDKINIIYYKCEDELYDKSIFIISK